MNRSGSQTSYTRHKKMNKYSLKKLSAVFIAALLAAITLFLPNAPAGASSPTDEILNYEITIDVNDDATLKMVYHLEWKVLDDSIGKVEWVDIGVPNSNVISANPLGSNITSLTPTSKGAGNSVVSVYFNKAYAEGEIIPIDFEIIQDYMYEMNILKEGESVFYFTPGWFNEIAVDKITISWNADKVLSQSHGATVSDGRLIWEGSLA
ncbi:MAG: hypothetical protein K6E95_08105, partial [Lachnospiraceae bacterium]|nr:hypothetical protein [Lachnospiraceae bacterium]